MSEKQESITPSELNKQNIRLALNVFLWTVFAAVLNFIIYMSLTMIFTGLSTKTIGERIYELGDEGQRTIITEIYYDKTTTSPATTSTTAAGTTGASGETTAQGTTTQGATTATLPTNQYKESIRSEFTPGASLALDIVSQAFMLVLFMAMVYTKLWERGDKDSNKVQFKHMREDKLRGIKIGLMAAVPSFILYILFILSRFRIIAPEYFFIYRLLNVSFMPVITRMAGSGVINSTDVSLPAVFGIFLTLVVLPLTCYAAYLLGYKNISLSEKIIYADPNKRAKRRRR